MPKFFVKENQIKEENVTIVGGDVNHIKNVLRLTEKNTIEVCNLAKQESYLCEIEKVLDEEIQCKIKEKIQTDTEPNVKVTIFQGLPKADKMELIIQKSVELGVYDITPVEMKRCIVKLDEKDKIKKIERWQKISEVAAKQCNRNIIPKINKIIVLKNICDIINEYDSVIIAYENETQYTIKKELQKLKQSETKKIGIVIGPEGGLDEKEVEILKQNGATVVTLGKRILRTETVAFNILSNIIYEFDI